MEWTACLLPQTFLLCSNSQHTLIGHKAGVYIGPSNISLTFWNQGGDGLGSTFPEDTRSSIQGRNFIRDLAFHAFLGHIYSGWGQGGRGMWGGLLQSSHVKWCWSRRGGAMTCHSILNLNLRVYNNSSLATSRKLVRRVRPLWSYHQALPFKILDPGKVSGQET